MDTRIEEFYDRSNYHRYNLTYVNIINVSTITSCPYPFPAGISGVKGLYNVYLCPTPICQYSACLSNVLLKTGHRKH